MKKTYPFQNAPRRTATSKRTRKPMPGSCSAWLDRMPVPWGTGRTTADAWYADEGSNRDPSCTT